MKTLVFAAMSFCCICAAQQPPALTGKATAQGPCSVANTGDKNQFTINCGIGKEQGGKMLAILNQILTRQLDPDLVMQKLEEILKAVGQRRLTAEQRTKLISVLSPYRDGAVTIYCIMGDVEGRAFAEDFAAMLRAAGWKVDGVSQGHYDKNPQGVEIVIHRPAGVPEGNAPIPGDQVPKEAFPLIDALRGNGVNVITGANPNVPAGIVELRIGTK